jgi:DNA-binding NarL/FixJ family response regulator
MFSPVFIGDLPETLTRKKPGVRLVFILSGRAARDVPATAHSWIILATTTERTMVIIPESTNKSQGARKVLIVDDHPLVRVGLVSVIQDESDLSVCAEAGTVREALRLVREMRPDIVILDLTLPDGGGLELLKRITHQDNAPHVLVCSINDANIYAQRVLAAGAKGYIHKHEATAQVITAIRRVLSGNIYLSAPMTQSMLQQLANEHPKTKGLASVKGLTDRELEVLGLIGAGHSASQIAERLHLSGKTIETHRAKIKRKLNLASSGELTRYAVQWTLEQH